MPVFGSVRVSPPSSAPSSRGPSRASSPSPGGLLPSKYDSLRIDGNLYDILVPRESPVADDNEMLRKEVHAVLRYTVSFTLSKPVRAAALEAEFVETMSIIVSDGDGGFREAEKELETITILKWTLWTGEVLEAGKEHTFEITGELPPHTPRPLRTPRGNIDHTLTVRLAGVTDSGRMRRTRKTIEVWNPFGMDADEPRP